MAKAEKICEVAIKDLRPYDKNAKVHSDEQVDMICNSIEEFGFISPCLIDKDNRIIAGHGRVMAAKKLGLKKVPCVYIEGLTEEQYKAYILVDNKLTELGGWDFDLLNSELDDIDLDMSQFGFDIETDNEAVDIVEDEIPETPKKAKSKLGQIYQLGEHRLMCGDSTDPEAIELLMDGVKADMVFTDPPYNVAFNGRSGRFDVIENDDLSENDFKDLIIASCNIIRTLAPKEYYIWCNWKFYGILQEQLDYKSCIVWAKNVFGMGKGYRHQHEFCLFNGTIDEGINNESDLWEIAKDTNYLHPTQKPVALCARALKNHKDANVVVDLFGGSGSTLIACEQLNRRCFMMELDPKYVDVIIERWETLTGKKAVLLNG